MGRDEAIAAHKTYMHDLICVALQDGVITEAERNDLDEVRQLLSISRADYDRLHKDVERKRTERDAVAKDAVLTGADVEGLTVCFPAQKRQLHLAAVLLQGFASLSHRQDFHAVQAVRVTAERSA